MKVMNLSICHTGTQKHPAAFHVSVPHLAVFGTVRQEARKPEQVLAFRAVKENTVSWG